MTTIKTRSQEYTPLAVFKSILVDRSGSMETFRGKQYEMVYRLLMDAKKQAIDTNVKSDLNLISFDTQIEFILADCDLAKTQTPSINDLETSLYPRGCTRFNDTLIAQIEILTQKKNIFFNSLSKKAQKLNPDIVQVLIAITDGEDNSSDHTVEETRNIVKNFRENGGRAILMAANMNAQVIGAKYGFNPEKCITVHNSNEKAIQSGFEAVQQMQRNITQGIDTSFTHVERSSSLPINQFYNDNDDASVPDAMADYDGTDPLSFQPPKLTRS